MSHRLTPALLCALALAALPASAAAQTPPDERANARAFADVGARLTDDVAVATTSLGDALGGALPKCASDRRLQRATERRQDQAALIFLGQVFGMYGRAVTPALDRATTALDAIQTQDPALQGGRTAWRTVGRTYRAMAKLPHVRICREQRAYLRGGFKRTPAIRRAAKAIRRLGRTDFDTTDSQITAAVDRLIELGIPADEAERFTGTPDDESDGSYDARAAQAPAPSRPLALLRAAS